MGVSYSPKIVTDGLVLALDAANVKSFRGEPTTNVITNTNLDTGWSKGYNTSILWNDYPPPDGIDSQVVSFIDGDGNGSGYWYSYGDYAPQEPNTTYTVSVYARTVGNSWTLSAYTADNSEVGRQYTNYLTVPGDGQWYRLVFNVFTTPSNTTSDSLSFVFSSIPAGQRCWLCAPQMEAKSYATPFVNGTRGATVATGGGVINRVPSTYTATVSCGTDSSYRGGWAFDGTDDVITLSSTLYPYTYDASYSVEAFIQLNTLNRANGILGDHQYDYWSFRVDSTNTLFFIHRLDGSVNNTLSGVRQLTTNPHYVAVIFDKTAGLRLYIDGELDVSNSNLTIHGYNVSSRGAVYIGQTRSGPSSTPQVMLGSIFSMNVYNRALTASEVLQNYNATKGRFGL